MRVMVLLKANQQSEAGEMPSEQVLTEMMAFNEELVASGIILAGDGLLPSTKGKRVRLQAGKKPVVIDGPFAETKELLAGFWIWQVRSMEEAVEWAKRIPGAEAEASDVELRPVGEIEDFGESITPEQREKGAQLRARMEKGGH